MNDSTRACSICKKELPLTTQFFHRSKASSDGFRRDCKSCRKLETKSYRERNAKKISERSKSYREANRSMVRAKKMAYYQANREQLLERLREKRLANYDHYRAEEKRRVEEIGKERINALRRARNSANPERKRAFEREYMARYRKENREKWLEQKRVEAARRKAQKLKAEGDHSAQDVKHLLETQRGKCHWCGTKLILSGKGKYHVDHKIPLSRGGSNSVENLCCSCPTCNLSKAAKMPWEFTGRLF